MKMSRNLLLLLAVISISASQSVYAQCKGASKKCLSTLAPYTFTDELNNQLLTEDESSELILTLFAGQDYRIALCVPPGIGNVDFKITDIAGNVVFDNKDHNYTESWDFTVNSSNDYFVQLDLVNSSPDPAKPLKGCVAVLVGFKM